MTKTVEPAAAATPVNSVRLVTRRRVADGFVPILAIIFSWPRLVSGGVVVAGADCRGNPWRFQAPVRIMKTRASVLRPDVKALIRSRVLLLPASFIDEKPPELFMRLHPEHGIDLVFFEHGVPGGLVDLQLGQLKIVTQ